MEQRYLKMKLCKVPVALPDGVLHCVKQERSYFDRGVKSRSTGEAATNIGVRSVWREETVHGSNRWTRRTIPVECNLCPFLALACLNKGIPDLRLLLFQFGWL